jgi:hypothetical protein
MPVFAITFAMIIIPASKKITLKSTDAKRFCVLVDQLQ